MKQWIVIWHIQTGGQLYEFCEGKEVVVRSKLKLRTFF